MNIIKQNLTVVLVAFATAFTFSLCHANESIPESQLPELETESVKLKESLDDWTEDTLSNISVSNATSEIIKNLIIPHAKPKQLIEVVTIDETASDTLPEERKS